MSVYLFTYHGHGTWMPDRRRGYVHRTRGLQPADANMAAAYRANQRDEPVLFDDAMYALLIETARGAGGFLDAVIHAAFAEPSHFHVLASWRHSREWKSMRSSIRSALTRAMNQRFGKRDWFADTPSRKWVKDRAHFDFLVTQYSQKHRGAVWCRPEDLKAAREREKGK